MLFTGLGDQNAYDPSDYDENGPGGLEDMAEEQDFYHYYFMPKNWKSAGNLIRDDQDGKKTRIQSIRRKSKSITDINRVNEDFID